MARSSLPRAGRWRRCNRRRGMSERSRWSSRPPASPSLVSRIKSASAPDPERRGREGSSRPSLEHENLFRPASPSHQLLERAAPRALRQLGVADTARIHAARAHPDLPACLRHRANHALDVVKPVRRALAALAARRGVPHEEDTHRRALPLRERSCEPESVIDALRPVGGICENDQGLHAGFSAVNSTAFTPYPSASCCVDALRKRNRGTTTDFTRLKPACSNIANASPSGRAPPIQLGVRLGLG